MTREQEKHLKQEYLDSIDNALQRGTEAAYQEIRFLCDEERYRFLAERDDELTVLNSIIRIWELERNRPAEETIIGRTAIFLEESPVEVTRKQLSEVYAILKFALLRLETELPERVQAEGICRVLALDLTPGAIVLTAEREAEDRNYVLHRFADLLCTADIEKNYPRAGILAEILRGAVKINDEEMR